MKNLREYVLGILKVEEIEIKLEEIEIPYVYVDSKNSFEHILLSYGVDDIFIVIVTNTEKIVGYHSLDLKEQYGIEIK